VNWRPAAVVSTCFVLAAASGVAVAFATQSPPTHRHVAILATQGGLASPTPSVSYVSNEDAGLYFATPEAAMRYLAAAWNRHDKVALRHVTTPDGRNALEAMRSEAVNLRLRACTKNPGAGDFTCVFDHDYPPSMHKRGHGTATFIAGPARAHGWYMTYFEGCG
jgi:hypothetical protein